MGRTLLKSTHYKLLSVSGGIVTTISCRLKINSWSTTEDFECENNSFLSAKKDITLFGKVKDSDEGILDDYTFQLNFNPTENPEFKTSLSDGHLFIFVGFSLLDLDRLENQLVIPHTNISFGVNLKFKEHFTFELPKNKKCQVVSFIKTLSKTT